MRQETGPWLPECEQEQLHLPGAIQSWGALLAVDPATLVVTAASENLADFLGIPAHTTIGQRLDFILGRQPLQPLLNDLALPVPASEDDVAAEACQARLAGLHITARLAAAKRLIEIERKLAHKAPPWNFAFLVARRDWLTAIRQAATPADAFALAVAHLRALTGFERTILYRFDAIGHGEVVAEDSTTDLSPFLGIRFPASDVPRQARDLYLRRRVRVLCDALSAPVPMIGDTEGGGGIDMSLTPLRAASPVHVQYTRNMGVRATIVVSVVIEGRLWGLLVAHDRQPRIVSKEERMECDLIGQTIGMALQELLQRESRIALAARECWIGDLAEQVARQCSTGVVERDAMAAHEAALLALCDATGAMMQLDGQIACFGCAPPRPEAASLIAALLAAGPRDDEPFATSDLGGNLPQALADAVRPYAAGALVLPFSYERGGALVWLRQEQAQEVRWAGDPSQKLQVNPVTGALLPRNSFAVWHELVRGRSVEWSALDIGVVRALRREKQRRLAGLTAEMRLARDAAARATQVKSEFLAMMSHEIRSPMSGLLGVLELLRQTSLSEEQAAMATMVHKSASMLLSVLNDILDFSKIEAGALTVSVEPHHLRALLKDLTEPLDLTARHKGLTLSADIAPDVPDLIMTDELRLRQILGNLLCNAIKFTAKGDISLTVRLVAIDGLPRLRFTVRDTGIGMDDDVVTRLFNPFMQADGSTTRRFGGTGLGLAISRKLANLMLGQLSATSKPGKGSEFTLTLPLMAVEPAGASGAVAAPVAAASLRPGWSVLVVDDDPTIRWLSRRQLEQLGCVVEVAEHGEIGLHKLQQRRFDLLLTDGHMPRMDGVALTRAVRKLADPQLRDIPIIGLTADVTEAQRELCLSAGMSELVIKPLTVERLESLLLSHLQGARDLPPSEPTLRSLAFDDQIYLSIFSIGDAQGIAWLRGFQESAAEDCALLRALFAAPVLSRDEIRLVAHRLAGACFSAGAILLGEAARSLERAVLAQEPEALEDLLSAVQAAHGEMLVAMAAFVADPVCV
jgi:light-regulated signal transduction histidine kinase (bacteriophytochrome)/DNA-binding response OmpR family regulator